MFRAVALQAYKGHQVHQFDNSFKISFNNLFLQKSLANLLKQQSGPSVLSFLLYSLTHFLLFLMLCYCCCYCNCILMPVYALCNYVKRGAKQIKFILVKLEILFVSWKREHFHMEGKRSTHKKIPSPAQMSQVSIPFLCLVVVTTVFWQRGHVICPGASVGSDCTTTTADAQRSVNKTTTTAQHNSVCLWVCMCEREIQRERQWESGREREWDVHLDAQLVVAALRTGKQAAGLEVAERRYKEGSAWEHIF